MPSSGDALSSRLHAVADEVVAALDGVPRALVLIDGRSGAGKSTLARLLADRLDATLVPLDGMYPGWTGLSEGAALAFRSVIAPFAAGTGGAWPRYDWTDDVYGDETVAVDATRPLIVEGCGVTTPASAALADIVVWLDDDAAVRRARALARDGETFRPYWDMWAAQEERHIAAHQPRALSTIMRG